MHNMFIIKYIVHSLEQYNKTKNTVLLSSCVSFYWAAVMRARRFLKRVSKCGGRLRT